MRRFVLSSPPLQDGNYRFQGKDFRYLARVLRLSPGDSFRALSLSGEELSLRVVLVGKQCLDARPERLAGPVEASTAQSPDLESDLLRRALLPQLPPIVLLQALPKAPKMDLIVRQATEAGLALILPFVAERSLTRLDATDADTKQERWRRIVREARQQSGSDITTEVCPPLSLEAALQQWTAFCDRLNPHGSGTECAAAPVGLILHQDPLAQGTFHGYLSPCPQAVAVAVGPEGGFTESELAQFARSGFKPIIVGTNVLRTETAALFAAAAVQVVLLEKTAWMPIVPESLV